jgi:hypothetical protein
MAPQATYIKIDHINKQKVKEFVRKTEQIDYLVKSIMRIEREIIVLWIEFGIIFLLTLYIALYLLYKLYPFK